MSIQELFHKGISFVEFANLDKDTYKEKTLELYENIVVDQNLENQIKKIGKIIYVLAFAEIWCPDCMINVPALQKIADMNPNIRIRIVPREGNEKYLEDYKVNGKPKIPTFIFMDEAFNIRGVFVEQPSIVKEIEAKGNQVEIIVAKRKYRKGEYSIETIKEILELMQK